MLYADPHFLGAIAQAIEVEPVTLEKWLNEASAKRSDEKKVKAVVVKEIDDTSGGASDWIELHNLSDNELNLKGWILEIDTTELDTEGKSIRFDKDVKIPAGGVIIKDIDDAPGDAHDWWLELRNPTDNEMNLKGLTLNFFPPDLVTTKLDAEERLIQFNEDVKIPANSFLLLDAESLEKLGITLAEGKKLLNKRQETSEKMDRRQYRNQRQVKIANPAAFSTSEENKIFSGPQPGEKLPLLNATSIVGESEGKTLDFAETDGQPLILFLQGEDGAGLRGLYDISRMIAKIANESKQALQMNVVFLGDDSDALKQKVSGVASGVAQSMSKNVLLGISQDGREGPGNYGLNRNVAQTILIAKDGKVLHNFAFTQPTVYADPHVLGAIAQVIGEDPASVEKWLNEASTDDQRMQRDKEKVEDKSNHKKELVEQLKVVQERLQRITESVSAVEPESQKSRLDHFEKLVEQLNADLERLQRIGVSAVKRENQKSELDHFEKLVEQLNADLERLQRAVESVFAAKASRRAKTDTAERTLK
jgi:Mg2+ and Co2+ transporter CorA